MVLYIFVLSVCVLFCFFWLKFHREIGSKVISFYFLDDRGFLTCEDRVKHEMLIEE